MKASSILSQNLLLLSHRFALFCEKRAQELISSNIHEVKRHRPFDRGLDQDLFMMIYASLPLSFSSIFSIPFPHSLFSERISVDPRSHKCRAVLRHLLSVAFEKMANFKARLPFNYPDMVFELTVHVTHSRSQSVDPD